jgi:uncharacterized protein YbjT (DUF2867 family)
MLGRHVVSELRARGHEVRALSRITAFDVIRDPDKLAGVSLPPEGRRER